ncbi:MAG TPA: hypothetical protein VN577_04260 [Terriglobales bacterium]|nr:hypothetical protein [Terriglobales bacterium]
MPFDRFDRGETVRTNGQAGTYIQRERAKAAVCGEQEGHYAVERRTHDVTYYGASSSSEEGLSDPSSISGTAEDDPPEKFQYRTVSLRNATTVAEV